MVRGPRARAVPKSKVMPEDGETLKAAMKAEKNGKLMNGNGSHQLLPPNPRKRGRITLTFSLYETLEILNNFKKKGGKFVFFWKI